MNNQRYVGFKKMVKLSIVLLVFLHLASNAYSDGVRSLVVKLRGVYDSKVILIPFDGTGFSKPISEATLIPKDSVAFLVPENLLPGEFLLHFDYRAKAADSPEPVELQLFLNKENIAVHANPLYLRGDSLRLVNDRENTVWNRVSGQSAAKAQQIGLLQQLLAGYNDTRSAVWKAASSQYDRLTDDYNQWLDGVIQTNKDLYVGHLFAFQHVQPVTWKLTPDQRFDQQSKHWFDSLDLSDTLYLRSRQMNEFTNAFVNLFGPRATSEEMRDSVFTWAGRIACEKASSAAPRVYGWMVDYFYRGYEAYNITRGMTMLEKYSTDPRCLTRKKQAIARRIEGIRTLVPGVKVKNIQLEDINGASKRIDFQAAKKDYQLLIFYDSECSHCAELLDGLKKWYALPQNKAWIDIYTVALDDKRETWEKSHHEKTDEWTDLYVPGGVNSPAAASYFVLSTPNLFVIDKHGVLINLPASVADLDKFLSGEEK